MVTFFLAQAAGGPGAAAGGTAWWESALTQFPVAALVVFVVFYFMRAMKGMRESHQDQIKDITDSDRKDRGEQQRVMTETFERMSATQSAAQTESMEIFKTAQIEATHQSSTITAQVVDALDRSTKAIDRSTESFGRFNATLEFRAVAHDDEKTKKPRGKKK